MRGSARQTFGRLNGFPALHVLDSTDPQQIRMQTDHLDLARTIFIVSSKSGNTLEPSILFQVLLRSRAANRPDELRRPPVHGDHRSRISAPELAHARGFRHVSLGVPTIGGRYSALSNFGMVPAAVMGLDVGHFLDRADGMARSCASCVPAARIPG